LYVHFVGVLKDIIYDKMHRIEICKMTFWYIPTMNGVK
jgi:hypothetical protein